jgi:putative tryptophan/tyrosine transport system substrate-binding protein
MTVTIGRRELLAALGGAAAAWPLAVRAQQAPMPVIGFLHNLQVSAVPMTAFRLGLGEVGYVLGHNVGFEFRSPQGPNERLEDLAADLVRRRVAVIATPGSTPSAVAAKGATATIPIVFGVGDDPVKLGLVASLNRPGGNLTGINFSIAELTAKRLGLFHELVPGAERVAVLINPADPVRAQSTLDDVTASARTIGLQIQVLRASTIGEIEAAFATISRERLEALFVGPDPFVYARRVQLAILAARHGVPTCFGARDHTEVGGLMSYGADVNEMFRLAGVYVGRILKGEKPADLPVLQPTKFELVINLATARALALDIPPTLLARADEVIE